MDPLIPFGLFMFMIMIIIYGPGAGYTGVPSSVVANAAAFSRGYSYFADTHVFVFFGFGFLMSFLYRNGTAAVGHSLLMAAFAALWGILNRGLWGAIIAGFSPLSIDMDFVTLVYGEFAAATVLVTLGSLMGRISAGQAFVLTFIEAPIYTINVALSESRFLTSDYGGSMQIFLFGTVFGLACAFVMDAKAARARPGVVVRSSRASDMTSLLGTLFMWCFWPSFNAVLAPVPEMRLYIVTNTHLALAMSTMMAFTVQHMLWEGKFNMNEVQYATLAGGVAMGAASNWTVQPFGALLIGSLSALLSVLGYRYVSPLLSRKLFLNDTCGTLNTFGIPGLAGGIAAVIASAAATPGSYATFGGAFAKLVRDSRSGSRQAGFQLLLIAMSIMFPLVTGAITGFILTFIDDLRTYYDDADEFTDPECVVLM